MFEGCKLDARRVPSRSIFASHPARAKFAHGLMLAYHNALSTRCALDTGTADWTVVASVSSAQSALPTQSGRSFERPAVLYRPQTPRRARGHARAVARDNSKGRIVTETNHVHAWRQQPRESNSTITRYLCACGQWGFRRHTSTKSDVHVAEYRKPYEPERPAITAQPNERPRVVDRGESW